MSSTDRAISPTALPSLSFSSSPRTLQLPAPPRRLPQLPAELITQILTLRLRDDLTYDSLRFGSTQTIAGIVRMWPYLHFKLLNAVYARIDEAERLKSQIRLGGRPHRQVGPCGRYGAFAVSVRVCAVCSKIEREAEKAKEWMELLERVPNAVEEIGDDVCEGEKGCLGRDGADENKDGEMMEDREDDDDGGGFGVSFSDDEEGDVLDEGGF